MTRTTMSALAAICSRSPRCVAACPFIPTTTEQRGLTLLEIQEDLAKGETIAHCPSCSLIVRVLVPPGTFASEGAADGESAASTGADAGARGTASDTSPVSGHAREIENQKPPSDVGVAE